MEQRAREYEAAEADRRALLAAEEEKIAAKVGRGVQMIDGFLC